MFGEVIQEKPRALCYLGVNAEDQNAVEMQTGRLLWRPLAFTGMSNTTLGITLEATHVTF